ncbi:hypothetical protein KZ663_08155 [Klebsiella pneumoniae]|nr:hypothetical protein [Klebsiella pneumoniae]UAA26080.1 hypothetical protein KZ663_08155 [Klebsiella pneumoniae]
MEEVNRKTEESIAAYCNFAGWTARHFKGQGVIYEIWNEWSNRKDKGANDIDSAKAYVKLVKYASACIKRSDLCNYYCWFLQST